VGHQLHRLDWIGLSSVLRPHQLSIGYMGDGCRWPRDFGHACTILMLNWANNSNDY